LYLEEFDSIVVGGGHAAIEAVLILQKMGFYTACITTDPDTIGKMSCNPSIGGLAKGHIVREIDALGGYMAKCIDETGIQFRMLNTSKGPAVWAPRAQADKYKYQRHMQNKLQNTEGIKVIKGTVGKIHKEDGKCTGISTEDGRRYKSRTVILTTGTFLKGLMYIGFEKFQGGRMGEEPARNLSDSLKELGHEIIRLKTGTPARINANTIDFTKVKEQEPCEHNFSFSHFTKNTPKDKISCYILYTNSNTHEIIRGGLDESPLFTGKIKGIGPRYCPSIEDKVVRFPHKERHQLFLEPEGEHSNSIYINGFSTSLSKSTQEKMLKSLPGLDNVEILKYGYAVEYDCCNPVQLKNTLESRTIENLYLAGQINGTSGYEEAAGQGLIAGINAGLKMRGDKPFIMDRTESYIAVLIDDLVTKGVNEPYRMFTSRAEYRLNLRYDNADERLMHYAHNFGTITDEEYEPFRRKFANIEKGLNLIKSTKLSKLNSENSKIVKEEKLKLGDSAEKYLKIPNTSIKELFEIIPDLKKFNEEELKQIDIKIRYEGYIKRQNEMIEQFRKLEKMKIPEDFDYDRVEGLLTEARQKLKKVKPSSLGQASRISGVNPSDISILMVYIKGKKALYT
jgi:tRNA uridine 5-carboxymethylaminomethyl modification enzyme